MRIAPVDYIYPRCSVYPHTLGDAEQSSWQHPHIPEHILLSTYPHIHISLNIFYYPHIHISTYPHIPEHILLLGKSLAYRLLSFLFVSNKRQNELIGHYF